MTKIDPRYISDLMARDAEIKPFSIDTFLRITDKTIFNISIPTRVDAVEYFSSGTQITANRIARTDVNYTGDNVTSEVTKIYNQNDGTTVTLTQTVTYTYTNGQVTNIVYSES